MLQKAEQVRVVCGLDDDERAHRKFCEEINWQYARSLEYMIVVSDGSEPDVTFF